MTALTQGLSDLWKLEEFWKDCPEEDRHSKEALDVAIRSQSNVQIKQNDNSQRDVHHWHFFLGPALTETLLLLQGRNELLHEEYTEYFFDTDGGALRKQGAWLRLRQVYAGSNGVALSNEDREGVWSLKLAVTAENGVRYKEIIRDKVKICGELVRILDSKLQSTAPMSYCSVSICGFTTHRYRVIRPKGALSSWWVDCALITLPDPSVITDPTIPLPDTCFACLTQEIGRNDGEDIGDDFNVVEHYANDIPSPSKAIIALTIRGKESQWTKEQVLALCKDKNPFGHTYSPDS
jgi:hypothetical protein